MTSHHKKNLRIRNKFAPSLAKCENCAGGGVEGGPLNEPFVATEKSYPEVFTPPRNGKPEPLLPVAVDPGALAV